MADKTCNGNCLDCSIHQQIYCSAQRTYAIMKNQEAIVARLDLLDSKVVAFDKKDINSILKDEAHNGSGAENREPSTI